MVIELTTQVEPYVYKWQNSLPNRTGLGPLVNQTQIVLVPIVVGVIIGYWYYFYFVGSSCFLVLYCSCLKCDCGRFLYFIVLLF
jgi:hypothetical protein